MNNGHQIQGIILQPKRQNYIFRGALICQQNGSFEGRLFDRWGKSSIEGTLDQEKAEMHFKKMYDSENSPIFYSFKKQGDLWIGSYEGSRVGVGEAQCELYNGTLKIDWSERLKTESSSMETAEDNALFFIEKLVKEGIVTKSKHPLTGEEILNITKKAKDKFSPVRNFSFDRN